MIVALGWWFAVFFVLALPISAKAEERDEPDISAHNAIVVDAGTGEILFARNADDRVPPASLTKLMTAFVAAEILPLDTRMVVSDADIIGEASMGVVPGESLSFDALLHGMLMASGNDAAQVVARETMPVNDADAWQSVQRFLNRANARAVELGLTNTHLANAHGLDEPNHYSSARDLALLTRTIAQSSPHVLQIMGTRAWSGEGHEITNTNDLLGRNPEIVAGKTGYTAEAGYCLVEIAQRNGRAVIVVLLGSTLKDWYTDAMTLVDYGLSTAIVPGSASSLGNISTQPQANAATSSLANVSVQSTNESSLVTVAGPPSGARWKQIVVACAGIALLSLGVGIWLLGSRLVQADAEPIPAYATATPAASHNAHIWETQPLPFGDVDWPTTNVQGNTSGRSGWTAALPIIADGAAERRDPAGGHPIGAPLRPAWRPGSSGD